MNLYKIVSILLFLSAMLITSACKKDKVEPTEPPLTPEELFYTECGKIPPVIGCIKGTSIFLPNAFTPNGDGFNDVFYPHTGYGIKEIISFKIYDEAEILIFQESNISVGVLTNDPERGWWNGKLPDGSFQDGIYNYTVVVANLLDEIAEFEGAVCCRTSFPLDCVENEKHIAWGTQHDGNGGFDSNLPSYEDCE